MHHICLSLVSPFDNSVHDPVWRSAPSLRFSRSNSFPGDIKQADAGAAPLLLIGIGFGMWLILDRSTLLDLLKQGFVSLAFILWGVDLLMPAGPSATFRWCNSSHLYIS
jgi:hypothetical protein